MDSDYPFGIFKLFLKQHINIVLILNLCKIYLIFVTQTFLYTCICNKESNCKYLLWSYVRNQRNIFKQGIAIAGGKTFLKDKMGRLFNNL